MLDGKPWIHSDHKRKWRHLLLTGPGGSAWYVSRGHKGRLGQGIGREEGRTWGTLY